MPPSFPNPLIENHQQAEAELQPYGPMSIVSTFGEPQAEYAAIRKSCGMMDQPHRGVLELTGRDRLMFLNNLVSNVTWDKNTKTGIAAGAGLHAYFLNLRGRIVADVNILELGDRTLVEADARLIDLLRSVWDLYLFTEQVKMTSQVGKLHQIALHGPRASEVLGVPELGPLASTGARIADIDVTVWRDDVCGVPGHHVLVASDSAAHVWSHLRQTYGESAELGRRTLRQVGWAAFNTARIEAGRPMLDIDFPAAPPDRPGKKVSVEEAEQTPTTGVLPAETGQAARAVAYTKCYLGQEIVARMHARNQVARLIVGLRVADGALPMAGTPLMDEKDNQIGQITSSTVSPVLSNAAIALAIVKKPHFAVGTVVRVPAEGQMRSAVVTELPFVK